MKIGCLGPEGSYSCLAARELSPRSEIILYKNFPSVFAALQCGEVDEIALPIENSLQGGVLQNMDLLAEAEELFAVKEYILPVEHRLVTMAGVSLPEITEVYSHPQALGQCSVFLSEKMPRARRIPTDSTAAGLQAVNAPFRACIVGAHLTKNLGHGYDVYPDCIADEEKNYTHFGLVKRGKQNFCAPTSHVYFAVQLLHRPGSLYTLLGVVNKYGLNMTKIESRPIKSVLGEYRFFIEVEGDYFSPEMQSAMREIEACCRKFKLLGCY